jgi:glutathione S-transferase
VIHIDLAWSIKMSLTLYYHPLASYCHKVLIALYENDVAFERRIIDLSKEADRAELKALWPFGKFPVIRDHGRNCDVPETTIIIEYLNRHFDKGNTLIPADWDAAHEVRLWDRIFDHHVHAPMQEIVADRLSGANSATSRSRSTLDIAYSMIDRRMASRTWVAADAFSLADCAAAPALFYAGTVHPFASEFTHLQAYLDRLVQRPSFKRVLEEAKPYFSHYPFAEAIPKRYL